MQRSSSCILEIQRFDGISRKFDPLLGRGGDSFRGCCSQNGPESQWHICAFVDRYVTYTADKCTYMRAYALCGPQPNSIDRQGNNIYRGCIPWEVAVIHGRASISVYICFQDSLNILLRCVLGRDQSKPKSWPDIISDSLLIISALICTRFSGRRIGYYRVLLGKICIWWNYREIVFPNWDTTCVASRLLNNLSYFRKVRLYSIELGVEIRY